ncbi:hypothetical protein CDD80_4591 [Ophiocordyceps camponoti-rufipedis]|uniref:F-box domain-containing protein n=1 Tax=Ophiocordyceps camponoti-rufipedis TaxID=2004952 RepID=A0A2C5YX60_9HYPO|nr:hypothetical protein CDD80_4591 [Ophiocordyceps camponoti-rufipedis]
MAWDRRPLPWDELPDEILLQILRYLEPCQINKLHLVSRKLRKLSLDEELWKRLCFQDSPWYRSLQNRRAAQEKSVQLVNHLPLLDSSRTAVHPRVRHEPETSWQRRQDLANWDPTYPGEKVSWYEEYIQRQGPVSVNWLQMPRKCGRGNEPVVEARGVALYSPHGGRDGLGTMLAVSPLEDGSICLWDVNGNRASQGSIVARSRPGSLFANEPNGTSNRRSRKVDADVIECVSVSDSGHRAFFAVQSHLVEVDLNRLDVVSRESFEWSITAMSAVQDGVPLTVGTSLGIHLHDFRARARTGHDVVDRLDGPRADAAHPFKAIFDPNPLPPYAPLSQPTPISILHLPRQGAPHLASDDIYVSGRFSNILHYDRRKFPSIAGSIYSGALIKSLTSLPVSFSALDAELRRKAELSAESVAQTKTAVQGQTLIAGGGYNTKGSLEMYGLVTAGDSSSYGMLQNSALKNRQTAASATILSVINHGTKLAFSDGTGLLKWFERDGTTECRRLRIGHSDSEDEDSLFASMPASDDLARKILSTRPREGSERLNDDNILFWTGERLGMVTFTARPRFDDKQFGPRDSSAAAEEEEDDRRRRIYGERMRRALDRQADEVRFMGNLGMGMGAR